MILQNLNNPNKSLFIIGANILETMKLHNHEEISFIELHSKYNEKFEKISTSYLSFGLDWLFILEQVSLTKSGNIELCN